MTDKTKPLSVELSLNVNTYDIDVAGHVNNIVYIRWLEDMRNILYNKDSILSSFPKSLIS
jgi:acyl-CoA thioesterase FadM